jgi:hypothetical protein
MSSRGSEVPKSANLITINLMADPIDNPIMKEPEAQIKI